jgi:hypothetical protein
MARNDGFAVLALLGLGFLIMKGKKPDAYSYSSSVYSTQDYGYLAGHEEALRETQRTYGRGTSASIPAIQSVIEQTRVSTPAPRTTRNRSRQIRRQVQEVTRRGALRKTQRTYGQKIPIVQDYLEANRQGVSVVRARNMPAHQSVWLDTTGQEMHK